MSRFEDFLRANREALASFIASVTASTREALQPSSDTHGADATLDVDRAVVAACHEAVARIGPGGFSAALHSALCERLDGLSSDRREGFVSATSAEPLKLTFALKDEGEVEEDIECARLVQMIESGAEAHLRELRALCTALRAWPEVRPDAPPLHPQACAAAMLDAARSLSLAAPARRLMLRVATPALAQALADLYASQVALVHSWGIKPARYKIRLGLDAGRLMAGSRGFLADAGRAGSAGTPGPVMELLQALLSAAAAMPGDGVGQLGMAGQASQAGQAHDLAGASGALAAPMALRSSDVMHHLLQQLPQQRAVVPGLHHVFKQLEAPGAKLAAQSPDILQDSGHPWWALLERLVGLCEIYESESSGLQDTLALICAPILVEIGEEAGQGDAADRALCGNALQALNAGVYNVFGGAPPVAAPDGDSADATGDAGGAGGAGNTQAAADTTSDEVAGDAVDDESIAALSHTIRDQMSRQIRSTTAPLSVRRFLQGPWVTVLATSMQPDSGDLERAQRYAALVDQILSPCDPAHPNVLGVAEIQQVVDCAREGLAYAHIPEALADSHLAGLAAHLSAEVVDDSSDANPAHDVGQHAALPTVPIDLHASTHSSRARRDCQAWLGSLRNGDRVRIFLDGQWLSLQLLLCDEAGDLFQFKGRGKRPGYSLTKAALERLRSEGLATSLDLVN